MPFFELLAGAALTLGLAIPVFMDKVMRPKYEERFTEFRLQNRIEFIDSLERALGKVRGVKRSTAAMTPEVYASMEELVNKWSRLRSDETRLDTLLDRREYLFVAWMISFGLSALSVGFPGIVVNQHAIGEVAGWYFALVMVFSVVYVVQLFDFDKKLSKFRPFEFEKASNQPNINISEFRAADSTYEVRVANELNSRQVTFERHPKIHGPFRPDFAIPSSKNPQYFVEARGDLSKESSVGWLNYDIRALRSNYPQVKMVVISRALTARTRRLLSKYWDYVFEDSEIEKLVEILKASTQI
ncbi:MAG: hypothetical protein ABSD99_02860 [Candidatus Bathyarchaeia archaeon]